MTDARWRVEHGDARVLLAELPDGCVQTCVTSPPYWGLRDYHLKPLTWGGRPGCRHRWGEPERGRRTDLLPDDESRSQARLSCDDRQGRAGLEGGRFCRRCHAWRGSLGLEPSPELYVQHVVEVMRAVRRVLRDDGTLWLVLGDTFAAARRQQVPDTKGREAAAGLAMNVPAGAKAKDQLGIPWQVALALRADGWWLRSDIVWAKPNPMPESVRDRPTRAHEYVFLLTKQPRYFYDHHAVREPDTSQRSGNGYARPERLTYRDRRGPRGPTTPWIPGGGRNRRSVWCIPTRGCSHGHIAAFPERLIEPCVLAGTPPCCCRVCGAPWRRDGAELRPSCEHLDGSGRSLVLDPFCGSGTTGLVACRLGRAFLGIDLNPGSARLARERITSQLERQPTGPEGRR